MPPLLRELLRAPNLLSAARIPIALAFPFVAKRPRVALALLALGGLSDVLDGWVARKLGQTSIVGAFVDGVADKALAVSVAGSLVASGRLSPGAALLLASREIGELPLVVHVLREPAGTRDRIPRRANALGKLASALDLATVVAILAGSRREWALVAANSAVGVLAAASYWLRELREERAVSVT